MDFVAHIKVRFNDVDNAGIGYYPRIIHFLHVAFEDFFDEGIGVPYATLLAKERIGFPAVHLETSFHAPLNFGDHLDVALRVQAIGKTSLTIAYAIRKHGEALVRAEAKIVTVCMDLSTMKKLDIPADLRNRLSRFCGE